MGEATVMHFVTEIAETGKMSGIMMRAEGKVATQRGSNVAVRMAPAVSETRANRNTESGGSTDMAKKDETTVAKGRKVAVMMRT